jgi:hypothetical protein
MPGWRRPQVDAAWVACAGSLDEAGSAAERFRLDAPDLPFDALMFALQDLMAPLDAFEVAARDWRRLRR